MKQKRKKWGKDRIERNDLPYFVQYDKKTRLLYIGCQSHRLDYWLEDYQEIGKRYNLPEDVIMKFHDMILQLIRKDYKGFKKADCSPCVHWNKRTGCDMPCPNIYWIFNPDECLYFEEPNRKYFPW